MSRMSEIHAILEDWGGPEPLKPSVQKKIKKYLKKKKGFSKLDNPNHQGETNTWLTPLPLISKLGKFDLDPCAYPGHKTAQKLICLPEDGLKEEWEGRVWLNPPYGKYTKVWLDRLYEHGSGLALVFARTDTVWFQEHFEKADFVFFLKGRLKFINPLLETSTNAGTGSCIIGYGEEWKNYDLKGILYKKSFSS